MSRQGAEGRRDESAADLEALLNQALEASGVRLSAAQSSQLRGHLELLLLWRRRLALVSQRAADEIVEKHVEDSLAIVPYIPDGARVADLGSGAGFPGIVIAVLRPATWVLLVESQRRKASFLRQVLREIGVANAEVLESRAEDVDVQGAGLDVVVSRAVWSSPEFFARALPLLKPGGVAIAMKTPNDDMVDVPPGYSACRSHLYRLRRGEDRVLLVAEL